MKRLAAFALAIFSCVPAMAQLGGRGGGVAVQGQNIAVEILEMEQEADKTSLKEALVLQARQGMRPETNLSEKEAVALHDFIAKKKEAISQRAAELTKVRTANMRGPNQASTARQPADQKAAIERFENSQIEVQLLQAQVALLQEPLQKAVEALAAAEYAADSDETQRAKAEAARKTYEKIKAKVVEHSKKLRLEQQAMQPMQMMGMGGMGGGFR